MRIVGKTKSHRWSISTPTADHTNRCSLSPFQRPFFQVDLGQKYHENLSTRHTYSDEPLSIHFVLSSYTRHAEWYDK